MTQSRSEQELAELSDQRTKAVKRLRRQRDAVKATQDELRQLDQKIHRARLKCLVGKPVTFGVELASTDKWAWLNDAVGTLVKVDRSYGQVDFADIAEANGCTRIVKLRIADIQEPGRDKSVSGARVMERNPELAAFLAQNSVSD